MTLKISRSPAFLFSFCLELLDFDKRMHIILCKGQGNPCWQPQQCTPPIRTLLPQHVRVTSWLTNSKNNLWCLTLTSNYPFPQLIPTVLIHQRVFGPYLHQPSQQWASVLFLVVLNKGSHPLKKKGFFLKEFTNGMGGGLANFIKNIFFALKIKGIRTLLSQFFLRIHEPGTGGLP